MANVNAVALCPYCKKELNGRPTACEHCKRKLKEYESPYFNFVDTITDQYARTTSLHWGKQQRSPTQNPNGMTRESFHAEMQTYYRNVTINTRVAIIRDAYLMMQNLLNADDHTAEAMKSIVYTAKRIGELGAAAELFLKSGGVLSNAKNPHRTFTLDKEAWEATGKG